MEKYIDCLPTLGYSEKMSNLSNPYAPRASDTGKLMSPG